MVTEPPQVPPFFKGPLGDSRLVSQAFEQLKLGYIVNNPTLVQLVPVFGDWTPRVLSDWAVVLLLSFEFFLQIPLLF